MDRITRNDTKHGSHAKQPTEPLHDDTVIDETPAPSDTTPFLGASSRERQATSKRRKPNFITKGVNRWCNRLLGAVSERSLADQEEEYAAHRTTRDYVWNTVGVGAWGMVFPILTVVVTQLVGVEQAGMFSMAFVTGMLLMFLANYGVRTYQVSDVTEEHSFSDYQINRWITCAFMVLVGVVYCTVRGYEIGRMPIGRFLRAARRIDGVPQEVLARLFPDAEDAVRALASLDRAGLIGLCARAVTVLPDEAVTVFAELAGLDEKDLRDDPNVGLDGLLEMIEAWMEVNNLENFIGAARALWRRARAGRTGAGSNG